MVNQFINLKYVSSHGDLWIRSKAAGGASSPKYGRSNLGEPCNVWRHRFLGQKCLEINHQWQMVC